MGEGLLEDRARNGLRVPLFTEVALRDLYDWMQRLLAMACEILDAKPMEIPSGSGETAEPDSDIVKLTWQLFDTLGRATEHRFLYQAIRRANDRLAPVRRANQGLICNACIEYQELHELWQHRQMCALKAALARYHERRTDLVPRIVASLAASAEQFP